MIYSYCVCFQRILHGIEHLFLDNRQKDMSMFELRYRLEKYNYDWYVRNDRNRFINSQIVDIAAEIISGVA